MQHSSNLHVTLPSSEERCVTSNGVNHFVTASRPQPLPNHLSFSSLTCHPSTLLSKPHENKLQALALVSSPQEVQQTIRWWPWNSNRIIQWSGFRENLGGLKPRTPSLTNHSYDSNLSSQSELKENHAVGAAEGKTYDEHHERNHNSESGETKIFQETN